MFCPVTYLLFSLGPFRIIAMQSQYISSFPQSKSQQTSSQNPSRICIAYSIAVFLFYVLYIKSHQPQTNHNLQFFVCCPLLLQKRIRQDFRAIPPDSPELDRDTTAVAACHARYAQPGSLAEGVDQKGITVPVSRTETGQYLGVHGDGGW